MGKYGVFLQMCVLYLPKYKTRIFFFSSLSFEKSGGCSIIAHIIKHVVVRYFQEN